MKHFWESRCSFPRERASAYGLLRSQGNNRKSSFAQRDQAFRLRDAFLLREPAIFVALKLTHSVWNKVSNVHKKKNNFLCLCKHTEHLTNPFSATPQNLRKDQGGSEKTLSLGAGHFFPQNFRFSGSSVLDRDQPHCATKSG